jgi:hypothetical protein
MSILKLSPFLAFLLITTAATGAEVKTVADMDRFFSRLTPEDKSTLMISPGKTGEYDENCGFRVSRKEDPPSKEQLKNMQGLFGAEFGSAPNEEAFDFYTLYRDDLTGDSTPEFILVNRCGGSAMTDTLVDVFTESADKIKGIGFDDLYRKTFKRDPTDLPMHTCKPLIKDGCLCFEERSLEVRLCLAPSKGKSIKKQVILKKPRKK